MITTIKKFIERRERGCLPLGVDLQLDNDGLVLIIGDFPMDRTLLLHDDVNVPSYQLGDGLTLCRLDRVE